MKKVIFTIATIVCCNAVFSQTDEKGIVLGFERSTADAFTKHNLVFLTAAYADNIHIITATGDVITKQELLQSMQNMTSATLSEMQVRIENYVAIVTGIEIVTG